MAFKTGGSVPENSDNDQVTGDILRLRGNKQFALPAGTYQMVIEEAEVVPYSDKGNQAGKFRLRMDLSVDDPYSEYHEDTLRFIDVGPIDILWASGKTSFLADQFFNDVFELDHDKEYASEEDFSKQFLGKHLSVTLSLEDDDYRFNKAQEMFEAFLEEGTVTEEMAPLKENFIKNEVKRFAKAEERNKASATASGTSW